jgi:hypothetical protein
MASHNRTNGFYMQNDRKLVVRPSWACINLLLYECHSAFLRFREIIVPMVLPRNFCHCVPRKIDVGNYDHA